MKLLSTRSRCRGGALVRFVVFLAAVFALFALAWMLFLPDMLRSTLSKRTGFDVRIAKLTANPFTGKFDLVGCDVNNPPDWPTREFVRIREFRAKGDVLSFFGSRAVIDDAVIDVERVTIVTHAQGRTNVALFRERLAGVAKKDPKKKEPEPEAPKAFLIRNLHLKFDRVVFADHTKKPAATREMNLKLDKTFTEVTSAKQIVSEALPGLDAIGIAIGGLVPGRLGEAFAEVTRDTSEFLKKSGKKAGEAVKGLMEKLEEKPKP